MRVDDSGGTRQFRRFERFAANILDKNDSNADGQFTHHPPIQPIQAIGDFRRLKERLKSFGDKTFYLFLRMLAAPREDTTTPKRWTIRVIAPGS
jgi:hypothetical protein